jgi:ribosomal protein S18 acetylase RimI-like enzyme
MSLELRILQPRDVDVLVNVAPGVFDRPLVPQLVTEFLSDSRHHLAVAVDRGVVVGIASGVHYIHPDKPSELWINEVAVAPSHQGKGVGKAVVETLLQHGRSLGCREAWVLTNRSNQAAMRLYATAGGEESSDDEVMFTFRLHA